MDLGTAVFDRVENRFFKENRFSRHWYLSFNIKKHFVAFLCAIISELFLLRNNERKPRVCVHFLEDKLRGKWSQFLVTPFLTTFLIVGPSSGL